MTKPLLSICIATYNRAEYIGETLKSIIPQITADVEVVIVDGASTDHTSSVVKSYIEVCNKINYVQLPLKGGVDQDFCKAVEFAQGRYCWLFTDDDLLEPNALSVVLNEVRKDYSLIVVNIQVRSKDLSRVLKHKLIPIDSNEIYEGSELEQLFQRVIPSASFIGCVVINRSLWMQREKEKYFGSEFVHVGIIFQADLPAPALILAKPYISIRYGNAHWTSRAYEVWMFKWPKLLYSFTSISEGTRQKHQFEKNHLKMLIYTLVFRALGAYSSKEYQAWIRPGDFSMLGKFAAWIIANLPVRFVNWAALSLLQIMKKDPLTIYDLENSRNNLRNDLFRNKL